MREPLELVRDGKVVARVSKMDQAIPQSNAQLVKRRSGAAKKLEKLLEKAWAHADVHGVSERQAVRIANKAVSEARRKHAARAH
jgi:hypothetical protein